LECTFFFVHGGALDLFF